MTPRPRRHKYFKGVKLATNVTTCNNGKSLRYTHPITGKQYGLGTDPIAANRQARIVNKEIENIKDKQLRSKISNTPTLAQFSKNYLNDIISERKYADKTKEQIKNEIEHICAASIGNISIDQIRRKDIKKFLKELPPRFSNQHRHRLVDIFRHAIDEEYQNVNPAEQCLKRPEHKSRKRLKLKDFWTIYNHESAPQFLKNAMEIMLITEWSVQQTCDFKFKDIRDNIAYTIRSKTADQTDKAYIARDIGPWFKKVIDQCRDDIASPYVVHRAPVKQTIAQRYALPHFSYVNKSYLSRAFAKVRKETALYNSLQPSQRPSLYEIKALSIKLHKDQNLDANAAAGHTTQQMTNQYDKDHDIEIDEIRWVRINEELDLNKLKYKP